MKRISLMLEIKQNGEATLRMRETRTPPKEVTIPAALDQTNGSAEFVYDHMKKIFDSVEFGIFHYEHALAQVEAGRMTESESQGYLAEKLFQQ